MADFLKLLHCYLLKTTCQPGKRTKEKVMRSIKLFATAALVAASTLTISPGFAQAAESDCSLNRVCLWGGANYTNGIKQLASSNPNITDFTDQMSSWKNSFSTKDAQWWWDANYVGAAGDGECMNSNSRSSWVGTHNNDELTSVKIYGNNTTC